jgi:hypothetical protein
MVFIAIRGWGSVILGLELVRGHIKSIQKN